MTEDRTHMPDTKLAQRVAEDTAELERRARLRDAERTTDDMALAYLEAAGRSQGDPYEPPNGFIGSYPRGYRVTHGARAFEATAPGATTPPPDEDCWTEVDPTSEPTPFWTPGPYPKNTIVRDAGRTWRALADGTDGPRPSEFPGGWVVADG